MSRIGKSIETVSYWLPRAKGGGEWGVSADGYGVSFWGDEKNLKLIVVMETQFFAYTKNH